MADAPNQSPAEPFNPENQPQSNPSTELEPAKPETTRSPVATPWLHLEPDVTHAVIAKTEEELLSGLSALMRNKIENEKSQRQLASTLHEIEEARKELIGVKDQVRQAEEELGARFKDHQSVLDEITRTQERLEAERNQHLEHQEALFKTRNEAEQSRRNLQNTLSELSETQETCRLMRAQVAELKKEITRLLGERESMLARIQPIRQEIDQRLLDRESIIEQVTILQRNVKALTEQKATLSALTPAQESERANLLRELAEAREELARLQQEGERLRTDHERLTTAKRDTGAELSDLEARVTNLRFKHAEHLQKLEETKQALVLVEQERAAKTLAVTSVPQTDVQKSEPTGFDTVALPKPTELTAPAAESAALPLLLGQPSQPVASSWDSYVLESEFFTEDTLDAQKIAALVSSLPGIEHALIVQQFGPVLAGGIPERLHSSLEVPLRDYSLLYDQLPNKVHDYSNLVSREATYQVGDEFLTLAGSKEAFLVVRHEAPKLRPGLPEKLAIVAEELGKMYPTRPDGAVEVSEK